MTTINQQMSNTLETAKSIGDFKMLMRVVEAAGLADTLQGQGPFTVFAPTDEAFRDLPTGALDEWLRDPSKLRSIVTYHLIDHKITDDEIHRLTADRRTPGVPTVQGSPVVLKMEGSVHKNIFVNDAKVIKSEVETSNGVIHIIDRVLLPPPATPAAPTPQTESASPSTTPSPSTTTTTTTTITPPTS
jgi:uncharacterized surface protein with fasciclin (FAS1) repeats